MQPGPTLYEAEQLRKKKGSQGLLQALGEPMSYAPNPVVNALGSGLLGAQYLTGEKPLEEGLSALAMMTGLLQGTKAAPIINNAIKVYHGSPHKFDKPDSSKIGTGEGAQAYGHGLYWAETPEVASTYKGGAAIQVHQRPENRGGKWVGQALAPDGSPLGKGIFDTKQEAIDFASKAAKKFPDSGNLYEANLRWPDPAREAKDPLSAKHFLDWDAYISELPKDKLDALKKAGVKLPDYWPNAAKVGDVVIGKESALNAQGIPGITYLDAGSRAAGEGTRNYVTFDDDLVELLKRNGMGLLGK
jgi:hypothetical protein